MKGSPGRLARKLTGVLLPIMAVVAAGPAQGRTLRVAAAGGGATATIQAAIDAAEPRDTVLVGPGTYTGPGNRDIELRGKSIQVIGEAGSVRTILDCQGRPGDPHRGFFIHEAEGRETLIRGFTVTGGYVEGHLPANYGGGILVVESSPTIIDCQLVRNRSNHFGGGMVCYMRASPLLKDLRFLDNEAVNNAGGLGVKSFSAPEATNLLFVRNKAKRGGGIWCLNSSLDLREATLVRNDGIESSGGIWSSQGKMSIRNCIIAFSTGGEAVSCSAPPSLVISCCDIFGNVGGDAIESCMEGGAGNISVDPQFSDPGIDDYSLKPGSPCQEGVHASARCGPMGYRQAPSAP
jgi:hypothetical protein